MSNGLYLPRRRRVEMNLLPLIDVLVMLIFFAFVTMQFRSAMSLNLTLPKVETAGRNEFTSPIIVSIDRESQVFFNGTVANEEQFKALVAKTAEVSQDVTVLIKIDENAPVKKMTWVMDACRKAGLNKIRLQSR
jgi:biopolymer transport protein ExbD